ncbi:hypothetical protein BD626DRAFT_247552, partial [Schizophyllum amplum]
GKSELLQATETVPFTPVEGDENGGFSVYLYRNATPSFPPSYHTAGASRTSLHGFRRSHFVIRCIALQVSPTFRASRRPALHASHQRVYPILSRDYYKKLHLMQLKVLVLLALGGLATASPYRYQRPTDREVSPEGFERSSERVETFPEHIETFPERFEASPKRFKTVEEWYGMSPERLDAAESPDSSTEPLELSSEESELSSEESELAGSSRLSEPALGRPELTSCAHSCAVDMCGNIGATPDCLCSVYLGRFVSMCVRIDCKKSEKAAADESMKAYCAWSPDAAWTAALESGSKMGAATSFDGDDNSAKESSEGYDSDDSEDEADSKVDEYGSDGENELDDEEGTSDEEEGRAGEDEETEEEAAKRAEGTGWPVGILFK